MAGLLKIAADTAEKTAGFFNQAAAVFYCPTRRSPEKPARFYRHSRRKMSRFTNHRPQLTKEMTVMNLGAHCRRPGTRHSQKHFSQKNCGDCHGQILLKIALLVN